ncbi:MAG: GlsB/YeaQ/YmgE family stress response membrane protein [Chloroflexi bacterium]|nr:GlsB/YeaQ/YmgE family stress response membrane protein [Chloroflexota bacterium]
MEIGQLIVWLITGALAGYLAGLLVRRRGFGTIGNIVVGLLGALLGGVLFQLLNIHISGLPTFTFSLADLIVAFVGAVVLILIIGLVARRQ